MKKKKKKNKERRKKIVLVSDRIKICLYCYSVNTSNEKITKPA